MEKNNTTSSSTLTIVQEKYFRLPLAISFSVISLTTFCGGVFVYRVVRKYRLLKSTVWLLLMLLTLSDSLNAIITIPTYIAAYIDERVLQVRWFCNFSTFVSIFFALTTIFTIAAISVCRSKVIADPYVSLDGVQYKSLAGFVLFTCLLSASLAGPPILGFGEYNYEQGKSWCTFKAHTLEAQKQNKCLIILICVLGYSLPTVIIIFSGVRTFLVFRNTSPTRIRVRGSSENQVFVENWKMARLMMIIIVTFLIFWTPIVIYLTMILIGNEPREGFWPLWGHIAHLVMFLHGIVSPFVYTCKHKSFNQEIKNMAGLCNCNDKDKTCAYELGDTTYICEETYL